MFQLDNNDVMPGLGLGTWKSAPGEVFKAVKEAIAIGYRHIDCAAIYGNEAEIGQALSESFREGVVKREDMWITSKLWNDAHARDDVAPALKKTLSDLQLDHLDLYLVHWPVVLRSGVSFPETAADMISLDELPISETWQSLETAVDHGLCRHIGVSNFSVAKLRSLHGDSRIKPAVNQIELHPYLQQAGMLEFCQQNRILVTAYSPLGSTDRPAGLKEAGEPLVLEDPTAAGIAERHGISIAQVLLAWALQRGTSVIPKSVNPGRMKQNLDAADVTLSDDDMKAIDGLDKNRRYIDGAFWALEGSSYTMANIWDE